MQNSRRSLLLASTGIVSGLTLHLVSSERREEQSRRFLKAVKSGPVGEVRKHIKDSHGDPNARHPLGWAALHVAAVNGRVDVVVALLEAGADPNIPGD